MILDMFSTMLRILKKSKGIFTVVIFTKHRQHFDQYFVIAMKFCLDLTNFAL